MPIHDWTRVDAGVFHNFHQSWTACLCDALNAGRLPADYFAMLEPPDGWPEDAGALKTDEEESAAHGGIATAVLPPEDELYARKANRVAIHGGLGNVVAVIRIVSSGNKRNRDALGSFAEKAVDLIRRDVNLLVVDLFPFGPDDPQGIHPLIWDMLAEQPFVLPPGKPLLLASYCCGPNLAAYLEPTAVGDHLHAMPLFLRHDHYVEMPLEDTYQATWNVMPRPIKRLFEETPPQREQ